ncbi:hypothetical protein [Microbacterium sp.]|uniref:hypothetical protein n=1 Tax=Microbacterium sp. TaxID=51671 RepID=UPI003A8DF1C3
MRGEDQRRSVGIVHRDVDRRRVHRPASTAKSGTLTFDISNSGDQVTEFYLLASDGLRIVGEVENIAPAASRT